MTCKITKGVKVSVEPRYEGNFESKEGNIDIFTYHVVIENKSEDTIKLLKRHWLVQDAADYDYEIEGNGVIGEQPILCPGEVHTYRSGSQLKCPIGGMKGEYLFKRMTDDEMFYVEIPQFQLLAPFMAN
mgnify:FL=1